MQFSVFFATKLLYLLGWMQSRLTDRGRYVCFVLDSVASDATL